MRHQSCFTTSFPGASPFINTGLCKGACALWQGQHLYLPLLLKIHSFSLTKQVNQHYRHNTFLFLSIAAHLLGGVCVAQGQEGGAVLCSKPVLCSIASTSHTRPLPWGIPTRGWGWQHTTHGPSSLSHHPVEVVPAAAGHRASLGVGPCNAVRNCPWNTSVWAVWGWQITWTLLHPWECPTWHPVPVCAPEQEQNPGSLR